MLKTKMLWKDDFDTAKMQEKIILKEWQLLIGRNKKGFSAVNITNNFTNISRAEAFFQTNTYGLSKDPLGWSIEDLVEKYGGVDHNYCTGPYAIINPNEPRHTILILSTKNWLNLYILKICKNDKGKEIRTIGVSEMKLSDLEIERKAFLVFETGNDEHGGFINITITDNSWREKVEQGKTAKVKLVKIYPEEKNCLSQNMLTIWEKEIIKCDERIPLSEEINNDEKQIIAKNIVINHILEDSNNNRPKKQEENEKKNKCLEIIDVVASHLNLSADQIKDNFIIESNDEEKATVKVLQKKKYIFHLERLFKPDGCWIVNSVEILEK